MDTPYRTIDVKPLSGALGAEIEGVDIASGLGEEQFAEIYRAFADYSVILFRNQPITQEQHITFARHWGRYQYQPIFYGRNGKSHHRRSAKRTRSRNQYRSQMAHRSFLRCRPRTRLDSLCTRSSRSGWRYDVFQYVQSLRDPFAGFATNARKP